MEQLGTTTFNCHWKSGLWCAGSLYLTDVAQCGLWTGYPYNVTNSSLQPLPPPTLYFLYPRFSLEQKRFEWISMLLQNN